MSDKLQSIGRNATFNILRGAAVLPATLLLVPMIVKYVGIEGYGLWTLMKTFLAYSALLDLGMNRTVTKFTAEYEALGDHSTVNRLFNRYIAIYGLLAGTLALAVFVSRFWLTGFFAGGSSAESQDMPALLTLTACVFGLTLISGVYRAVLNGIQRMDITSAIGIATVVMSFAGSAILLRAGFGIQGLILADALAVFVAVLLQVAVCRKIAPFLKINPRLAFSSPLKGVNRFNSMSAVQVVLGIVHYQSDKLIIGYFLGLEFLAYYDIGMRLVSIVAASFGALVEAVVPAVSGLFATLGNGVAKRVFQTLLNITALAALPMYIFILSFAPEILLVWVDSRAASAVLALRFLCVVYLLGNLTSPADAVLSGIGRLEPSTLSALVTAVLSVIMSVILVVPFGFIGVLVSAVVARFAGVVYFFFHFSKVLDVGSVTARLYKSLKVPTLVVPVLLLIAHSVAARFTTSSGQLISASLIFTAGYLAAVVAAGAHTSVAELFAFRRGVS